MLFITYFHTNDSKIIITYGWIVPIVIAIQILSITYLELNQVSCDQNI
jgi:hypothetical protein